VLVCALAGSSVALGLAGSAAARGKPPGRPPGTPPASARPHPSHPAHPPHPHASPSTAGPTGTPTPTPTITLTPDPVVWAGARTLEIKRDDRCGVLLTLGYSNGVHVPLCWEPGCWATIRESSEPTSNCGPAAYRGAVAPTGDAELRIRYDAGAAFCVDGITFGDRMLGTGGEHDCANWGCWHFVVWAFTHDPFGVRFEDIGPCGVVLTKGPYAKPLVDNPLGGEVRDPQVLGGKTVRPPGRTIVPKVGAVIGSRGIPGLGGWRYRDLLADDTSPSATGLSSIDLAPPARHHDAGRGGLLRVLLAAAVVLAAVAVALRVRVPQPHGAHAL